MTRVSMQTGQFQAWHLDRGATLDLAHAPTVDVSAGVRRGPGPEDGAARPSTEHVLAKSRLTVVSPSADSRRPPVPTPTPGSPGSEASTRPRHMRLMGAPMGVVTEAHAVHAIIAAAEAG